MKMKMSHKMNSLIMIVLVGVVGIGVAQTFYGVFDYSESLDLQEAGENTDELEYVEGEGLVLVDGYSEGAYTYDPMFEEVEASVENVTGVLDNYVDDESVDLTFNVYDEDDELVKEELVSLSDLYEEDGEEIKDEIDLEIGKTEYLEIGVGLSR